MLKLLFELFLLYIAYVVIFDFIVPVYRTTKNMKQKMGEMQQKMQEQERQAQANASAQQKTTSAKHDYIDFEEVK